jgi:hypothetical protein
MHRSPWNVSPVSSTTFKSSIGAAHLGQDDFDSPTTVIEGLESVATPLGVLLAGCVTGLEPFCGGVGRLVGLTGWGVTAALVGLWRAAGVAVGPPV